MHRSVIVCSVVTGLVAGAWTQSAASTSGNSDLQRSEISAQVSGVFTRNTNNTPTTHLATDSAGLLVGYRLHLNAWEALELEYGYTRNGQRYFTPAIAGGAPAAFNAITADMHQLIANEVITTPRLFGVLEPFLLAGGGALFFRPRSSGLLVTSSQTRGTFNYGAGVNFHLYHLGMRVEYQGLLFKIPDFHNPLLNPNKWTHVAQPSVGLLLTF